MSDKSNSSNFKFRLSIQVLTNSVVLQPRHYIKFIQKPFRQILEMTKLHTIKAT